MKSDTRLLTLKILTQFEKNNKQLGIIRNHLFSQYKPDTLVRSRVMALSNEIIRFRGRLDLLIEKISSRSIKRLNNSLRSILHIGFYEILYDEVIPDYAAVNSCVDLTKNILNRKASGLTNAVLRKLIREKEANKDWNLQYKKDTRWDSIPAWLQLKWKDQFGDDGYHGLIKKFNRVSSTFIRNDHYQYSMNELINKFKRNEIDCEKYSKNFLKVNSGVRKVISTELFQSGHISIQDPASGAVVDCLDPIEGETILDVCASPGTKSLYLSSLVGENGKIYSSDIDPDRVKKGKLDIKRHKRKNIYWSVKDATINKYNQTDKILVDAPCSGTGVIGRKPDIRWRRKPNDILQFASLQLKILCNMAQYLKTGGTLVYATCSLETEENWNVVEQFLKLNTKFLLDPVPSTIPSKWIDRNGCLNTSPHVDGVDGMFAARLKHL